jgi:alkaline phosphatase
VAVFESEGPDKVGHVNASLDSIVAEMLEFDRAVATGLEYARVRPNTLVVVTSDHETGGLALAMLGTEVVAGYVTLNHTGAMVPIFALGRLSERFEGFHENDEIGRLLLEVLNGQSDNR